MASEAVEFEQELFSPLTPIRSYREVAEIMGMSHEKVRQIERAALRKLRLLDEVVVLGRDYGFVEGEK